MGSVVKRTHDPTVCQVINFVSEVKGHLPKSFNLHKFLNFETFFFDKMYISMPKSGDISTSEQKTNRQTKKQKTKTTTF